MSLWLRFYFNMCGGLGTRVDYGCPHDGVSCDEGAVRVDVVFWAPSCMIWADVGGVIVRGCFPGYGRIWVLVSLVAVKLGGVFEVEGKGYGLGVLAEYSG